jgi:hypothetical protein
MIRREKEQRVVRLTAAAQSRDDAAEVLILVLTTWIGDSLLHPVDRTDVLNDPPFEAGQLLGEPADDEAG